MTLTHQIMSFIFAIDVLGIPDDHDDDHGKYGGGDFDGGDDDDVDNDDDHDVVVEVERCRVSGVGAPPQSVSKGSLIASRHKSNFGFPCLY